MDQWSIVFQQQELSMTIGSGMLLFNGAQVGGLIDLPGNSSNYFLKKDIQYRPREGGHEVRIGNIKFIIPGDQSILASFVKAFKAEKDKQQLLKQTQSMPIAQQPTVKQIPVEKSPQAPIQQSIKNQPLIQSVSMKPIQQPKIQFFLRSTVDSFTELMDIKRFVVFTIVTQSNLPRYKVQKKKNRKKHSNLTRQQNSNKIIMPGQQNGDTKNLQFSMKPLSKNIQH